MNTRTNSVLIAMNPIFRLDLCLVSPQKCNKKFEHVPMEDDSNMGTHGMVTIADCMATDVSSISHMSSTIAAGTAGTPPIFVS